VSDNGYDYGGDIPSYGSDVPADSGGDPTADWSTPDAPGQSTSDPFSAGAPDSPGPDSYDADMPDVGAAGMPGASLIPSLPSGVQQSQLAAFMGNSPQGGNPQLASSGALVRGGAGLARAVSQRLGRSVSVGGILALLAKYGWQVAAQVTGLNAQGLLSLWMTKHKGRRRRGITYRQMQNAARVNRAMVKMYADYRRMMGGGHHRGGYYKRKSKSTKRR